MSQLVQPSAAPVTGPELDNRRILAALIDVALLAPMVLVLVALFGEVSAGVGALGAGWALFYYFALESNAGQTVGKRVMKLRVVRADGGELDMGRVAVRTLLRPLDVVGALIAMIATGRRRQRIGDLAAGTVVTDAAAPVLSAAVEAPPAPEVEAEEPVEGDTGLELEDVQPHDFDQPKPAPDIGSALPAADDGYSLPEVTDFDPFAKPEAEVAPEPEVEAEQPPSHLAGPLPDAVEEAAPEAEVLPEPVAVAPEPEPAPDVEAEEAPEVEAEPAERPKLEIISSAIDLVMAEDPPESSDQPEDEDPAAPSTP